MGNKSDRQPTYDSSGLSIITLAFILPIVLLLVLASFEFFLYFRAVSVVERAASEAAKALVAATPGKGEDSAANSFSEVLQKQEIRSVSGGDTLHNLRRSFIEHGQLYEPMQSKKSPSTSIQLPFSLSRLKHPPDPKTMNPGVEYLPLVTAWTCLEPQNESAHDLQHCSESDLSGFRQGFLTYQLPSTLDFDGDSHEDLVFFSYQGAHAYWWVLPSSGGTLFRSGLALEQDITTLTKATKPRLLPCPADYDGDGKTDFCIAATHHNTIELDVRFSTELYLVQHSLALRNIPAGLALPVPGRYLVGDHRGNKIGNQLRNPESFAAILLEGDNQKANLATYIWPSFINVGGKAASQSVFTIEDRPVKLDDADNKPAPGRNWRPAYGDHDGDGSTDIGWLTWAGGYLTSRFAGEAVGLETRETPRTAYTARMSPWGLFYPRSSNAAGLYVVEKSNHRISLITSRSEISHNQTGHIVGQPGENYYVIIAGKTPAVTDSTLAEPDPVSRGVLGAAFVPTASGQKSCPTCPPGGSYSGDGGNPINAALNSPTAVYSAGLGPLFIADYGNLRVRKIQPREGRSVNGSSDEVITTIAGGTVAPGVTCPPLADGLTPGPAAGEPSLPWDAYSAESQAFGIHPTCVAVRPLSLEMDVETQALFIGDEMGVIFAVSPGDEGWSHANSSAKMTILAGGYRQWSENPIKTGRLGFPSALTFDVDKEKGNRLIVVSRAYGIPSTTHSPESNQQETAGGIFQIIAQGGSFRFTAQGQTTGGTLAEFAGTWKRTKKSPGFFGNALTSPQGDLRNPTGIALYHDRRADFEKMAGAFITGWWADSKNNSWENSLIHIYSQGAQSRKFFAKNSILPVATVQWLNNPHTNSWGVQAPRSTPETFAISSANALPLATLPVEPSAGVALSADNHFLYFSQTRLGQIMVVSLDADGDGSPDLPSEVQDVAHDRDRDGDGIPDVVDEFQFIAQAVSETKGTRSSPGAANFDRMDIFQDAVLWAKSATGVIDANGVAVDRLEWWLDRFADVDKVPYSATQALVPEDQPPFTLLNVNTIIAPNPRGVLHSTPVWPLGIARASERNLSTGKFRLAPIIFASPSPSESQIKDISGYDQCSDWTLDVEATEQRGGLLHSGEPLSVCGRNLGQSLANGIKIGIRRAHLSHWANQWHPFSAPQEGKHALSFIDWDGDGARNPSIYAGADDSRPLMVYIGKSSSSPGESCPGEFAIPELNILWPVLQSRYTPQLTSAEKQYDCAHTGHFFSSQSVPFVGIMADAHAEWATTNLVSYIDYPERLGNRLQVLSSNGNAAQHNSSGPVAETAYQILERSLKIKRRGSVSEPFDAQVDIVTIPGANTSSTAVVVQYVWPMNRFLAKLFGKQSVIIKQSVTRRVY